MPPRFHPPKTFLVATLLGAAWALLSLPALAETNLVPDASEIEESIPEGGSLTGREIYERFLQNRNREGFQQVRVVSRDPGGSEQTTRFTTSLQDFRDEKDEATDGILAKMLVQVSHPFDMRHTAYLMIAKDPGPDDEFVYQPSQRLVRRVDLKNMSLLGTDYTFNDIAFKDIEDASYFRFPDEVLDDTPVYVVEANVNETIDIQYHRTRMYMEKEHYIPLRVRYWDDFGVEVKEMTASQKSIRSFGDLWVATESTMRDIRQKTSSTLHIEDVDTEPNFHPRLFSTSVLAKGK
jgi:hypothetical protein